VPIVGVLSRPRPVHVRRVMDVHPGADQVFLGGAALGEQPVNARQVVAAQVGFESKV